MRATSSSRGFHCSWNLLPLPLQWNCGLLIPSIIVIIFIDTIIAIIRSSWETLESSFIKAIKKGIIPLELAKQLFIIIMGRTVELFIVFEVIQYNGILIFVIKFILQEVGNMKLNLVSTKWLHISTDRNASLNLLLFTSNNTS